MKCSHKLKEPTCSGHPMRAIKAVSDTITIPKENRYHPLPIKGPQGPKPIIMSQYFPYKNNNNYYFLLILLVDKGCETNYMYFITDK